MSKRLIVPVSVAVVFLMGAIAFAAASETRYKIPLDGSPAIGPPDAPLAIVEFIDYQ